MPQSSRNDENRTPVDSEDEEATAEQTAGDPSAQRPMDSMSILELLSVMSFLSTLEGNPSRRFVVGFFPPSGDHRPSVPLATPKQTLNETRFQSLMSRLKDHLPQEEIDKVEAEVEGLRCMISMDLPDTPVYLSDSPLQIYEQSQLKHWFTSQPIKLHPITRAVIADNVSYSEATETGQAIQQLLSRLEERLEVLSAGQRRAY